MTVQSKRRCVLLLANILSIALIAILVHHEYGSFGRTGSIVVLGTLVISSITTWIVVMVVGGAQNR
jgi:ABC-type transport system involved in cytochrome c biogenesis permease component